MSRFLQRLAERLVVAFAGGFTGVLVASNGELNKALLGAALAAGVHAAYGALVKGVGESDRPDAL